MTFNPQRSPYQKPNFSAPNSMYSGQQSDPYRQSASRPGYGQPGSNPQLTGWTNPTGVPSGHGGPWQGQSQAPKIQTYLIHNILSTVICCSLLNLIGIIVSARADSLQKAGDHAGAKKMANFAKWLWIIGMVAAVLFFVSTVEVEDGVISWGFHIGNIE